MFGSWHSRSAGAGTTTRVNLNILPGFFLIHLTGPVLKTSWPWGKQERVEILGVEYKKDKILDHCSKKRPSKAVRFLKGGLAKVKELILHLLSRDEY